MVSCHSALAVHTSAWGKAVIRIEAIDPHREHTIQFLESPSRTPIHCMVELPSNEKVEPKPPAAHPSVSRPFEHPSGSAATNIVVRHVPVLASVLRHVDVRPRVGHVVAFSDSDAVVLRGAVDSIKIK